MAATTRMPALSRLHYRRVSAADCIYDIPNFATLRCSSSCPGGPHAAPCPRLYRPACSLKRLGSAACTCAVSQARCLCPWESRCCCAVKASSSHDRHTGACSAGLHACVCCIWLSKTERWICRILPCFYVYISPQPTSPPVAATIKVAETPDVAVRGRRDSVLAPASTGPFSHDRRRLHAKGR